MMENEAKEWLRAISATQNESNHTSSLEVRKEALYIAIQALEENRQYRAIGTIEEFKAFKLGRLGNKGFITIGQTIEEFKQEIRAKAIDEFAEKITLEISESIIWDMLATMSKNGSLSDTSDKIVDYVIDTAKRIAEQMKGEQNE